MTAQLESQLYTELRTLQSARDEAERKGLKTGYFDQSILMQKFRIRSLQWGGFA